MTNRTVFVIHKWGLTVLCPVLSYSGRKRTSCHKFYGEISHATLNMGEKRGERIKYFLTTGILSISSLPLVLLAGVSKFLSLLETFVKKGLVCSSPWRFWYDSLDGGPILCTLYKHQRWFNGCIIYCYFQVIKINYSCFLHNC